jgi:hypothetical protein
VTLSDEDQAELRSYSSEEAQALLHSYSVSSVLVPMIPLALAALAFVNGWWLPGFVLVVGVTPVCWLICANAKANLHAELFGGVDAHQAELEDATVKSKEA